MCSPYLVIERDIQLPIIIMLQIIKAISSACGVKKVNQSIWTLMVNQQLLGYFLLKIKIK